MVLALGYTLYLVHIETATVLPQAIKLATR